MAPSASLNAKERASAAMAGAWRNHTDHPARGEDGVVRWQYGASLPSVVCSPLQVCDVGLQRGETVNAIHVGDKVRWNVMPAVSGDGADRTTHLIIKPTDAGLVSSVLIFTDRRVYSLKLISTQRQWTPLTGFDYPDSEQAAWASYGVSASQQSSNQEFAKAETGDVDFDYTMSGTAPWRPLRVYSVGGKIYIQFPRAMAYGNAPTLIGLADDGGLFTSPSQQMMRYRVADDRYIVDGIFDRAELVTGVGGGQTKILITHRKHQ
jgi:P-type conjugative transfer protein TrbG